MDAYGWERLRCTFFTEVCRRVLGSYFGTWGFAEKEVGLVGEVVFLRDGLFLEVGYEPETSPTYSPTIVLGTGQGKFDEAGRPSAVPLWYIIPDDSPARAYASWTFRTKQELEGVLIQLRDSVLKPHARPLWLDLNRLERIISRFRAEI